MREKESKIMRLRRKLQGARRVRTRYWEIEILYYKGSMDDAEEGKSKGNGNGERERKTKNKQAMK